MERVCDRLPLARLGAHQTYLVAWDGDDPIAHAHIAWTRTRLGVPEIQDVFVREDRRREGIGEELMRVSERAVAARGHSRVSLSHGIGDARAKALYAKLGYREAGIEPQRVRGTIELRLGPVEIDDTLIYLVKEL